MEPIDVLAAVGEVLSWIGLGIGLPLLVLGAMVALAEGRWEQMDVAVIERAQRAGSPAAIFTSDDSRRGNRLMTAGITVSSACGCPVTCACERRWRGGCS